MPRGIAADPINDGRRKPAEQRADARVEMRWPRALKAQAVKAAQRRHGRSLAQWLAEAAEEKLAREQR